MATFGAAPSSPPAVENYLNRMQHSGSFIMKSKPMNNPSTPVGSVLGAVEELQIPMLAGPTFPHPKPEDFDFMEPGEVILENVIVKTGAKDDPIGLTRAGPRERVLFKGEDTRIGILTCGGLCPGLNTVIQGIVCDSHFEYNVPEGNVLGIRGGFRGFSDPELWPPLVLTEKSVSNIHNLGGTILGSNRGGFEAPKVVDKMVEMQLDQLYCIGGDGTHAAAMLLTEEIRRRGLKIAVVGVPKTIDNDIMVIDRSFGFDTAVQEAVKAIKCARIEASACLHGIGIVKVMGRSCGYLAAHAALASRDVDICLIPEVEFDMEGPGGLIAHLRKLLRSQGYCVILVSEGTPIKAHQEAAAATG
eukprot:CAMPEP_0181313402 /NCGR_PEP_ID=MMETSP1101-20121128/14227_1 /TAXON_ID=46948 /ORGANISM="Rhodomonas abbreviata, Strain Caron Lab Isolate" /LENGTH=358 /DNA_ID=CAMNT_0023420349 /DNA_START=208 /DNA_END=1280 /DNA_ORIENTATION=+